MMPTEAMRLDAEEEAARGAVEHLLKTLESDAAGAPPPLGKLPAHDAPPVEPKGQENGKVVSMALAIKCEPEEHNGSHCDAALVNGTSSPVQNGTAEDSMEDDAPSCAVKQEPQNEEDVSCVLSNVLDEVENNVVTNLVTRDTAPVQEVPEQTNDEDIYEVVQEVVIKVEDLASVEESKENVDTRDENVTAKSSQGNSEPILLELEKPDKELENAPIPAQLPNAPAKLPAIPEEKSPKGKKSKSKAKVAPSPQKPVETPPHEELDSAVSKCMSNICDVLDSVDSMVTSVEKTPPPKANSKKESPVKQKEKTTVVSPKMPVEPQSLEVEVPKKKDTGIKKKEKEKAAIKLPPKVPTPPEKAKRKPRKKAQQPLVAPVLPFPTYFPPPPMMVPPPPMPLPFAFPTPVPVDLSVGKKKVQKVAPISSMLQMMPPVATTSVADQVLDLSFKRQGRPPSEKKVKPIKRLSKKALQSVFHPYNMDPAELMRMTASPLMPPPPVPAVSVSPPDNRRGKKGAQNTSNLMQTLPKPMSPFVFQIEEYHVGVAPNGTKVYNCDVCSSSYQRQFSLKRHYLRTHVNARLLTERDAANCGIALGVDTPSNVTDLYRCHLCTAVFFARRDKLVAHLALHPMDAQGVLAPFPTTSSSSGGAACSAPVGPPSQVFSCDACSTTFTSRVNLLKHEALHQVQEFPCFYCYRVFSSQGAREKHHVQHTNNDNQQPCMFLCGKTFRTLQELRSHLQSMHNKEYFGCLRCNERFLDHAQLELHARMVHSGPVHEPPIISITPIIEHAPLPPPPPPPPPPTLVQKQPTPPQSDESPSVSTSTSSPSGSGSIKYSCSDCSETFPSYVSMCKHRRSTHGTVGKHTKAASPQKAPKESTPPPPPPQAKPTKTVMVYLESKEEHEAGQKTETDKFSLPKLASGKQTVALTSEVTISALPPEEEDEEREMEEIEQLEVEPNIEELVDQPSPPPQDEEPPAVETPEPPAAKTATADKKKPELKLTVKLNFGKKTAKSKNVNEVIKKKKVPKKNAVPPKITPKAAKSLQKEAVVEDVEKQTEEPVEQQPKKAETVKSVQVEAPKSASDGKKVDSVKPVPEIKIQLAPEPAPVIEAGFVVVEPSVRPHPKKFLSRNRERSPLNREDLSHLSLSTQAAVKKRNSFLKRKQAPGGKKNSRKSSSRPTRSNPNTSEDLASFLQGLDLGMSKYHSVSAEKAKKRGKKLLQDESFDEEVLEEGFTGDWIRPRRYICHICRGSFTELWDLDDHVNEVHTNIWCTYMDVDATTSLPEDIFVRSIDAKGLINEAPVQPVTDPTKSACTKCAKICTNLPDLHTHMLECGGDTTWMLNSPRKKKQWRPFGTRRRARRGMKRIPSSPVKLNRTNKKLDGDSIQKMIANLPSKRGSRRVINFNDDDIKTRSQATIHSLRPGGSNQTQSKTRLGKQQLPRGRPTSMALAERRISSEFVKTATKTNKQTAKSLPVEAPTKPLAAESQAPIVVKLKSKKMAKKNNATPETETPVVAIEPPPAAPVEAAPAEVETPPVEAIETPVEEAAKINKYAATKCHYCEKGLLNYFSLIRHLKCCPKNPENHKEETAADPASSSIKEESQAADVVKSCPLCNEVFSSSKLLERHASSCCESPTEIGNRKKLFRRRPSEVSVSSKKSESESVKSSVSDVSKVGKRRKKGKSKPFYLKKKLMYKAKNNPLTLQMLTKKFEVQDIPEKSKEAKERPEKATKKKYSKRKSELENLALPIIPARDEDEKVEVGEKSKKELPKKPKKSLAKEDLIKPDQTIEAELSHLAPEKHVEPTVSDIKQNSEKIASSSDDGKQKKMSSKASKKAAPAVEPSKSEVEVKLSDDSKRKRKSEPEKEAPVTESAKKNKKDEKLVEKTKQPSKPKLEKKKGRKSAAESQPILPGAVPEEKPVEKEPQPEELSTKSKSKSKKLDVSKPQVEANPKQDDDEELPLSQIIKLKKAKIPPNEPEQQLEDVSSAEPSLPKPVSEPVKPKKEKKSVGKAVENKSEPAIKKAKIDEKQPIEENQSEKRTGDDSLSEDSSSPKKKRGRRSDEREQLSTFCKICGTGYSTAFNYHKHLKSMKHLKHVLASDDGHEPSSRATSPLPPSPNPHSAESSDRTLQPGDQIEVDEEEKEEKDDAEEEVYFPFIKEGTPPPECPPPPPPSPCTPLREDDSIPLAMDVQQTPTVQDAAAPKAAPETAPVVKEFDDDEDDDWMQPTQLPPQPKWDFDAVRDSVSSWSNKSTFESRSQPALPQPPVAEPVLQDEEPKTYDHVLGGIVNQFINAPDDFEELPERPHPQQQEEVLLPAPNPYLMVNYEGQQSFDEIQMAMGATDEEMAMLENLGGAFEAFVYDNSGANAEYEEAHPGSSATLVNLANATGPIEPLENADLMDLDNQVSEQPQMPAAPSVEELQPVVNKYAAKPGVLLEPGEQEMVEDESGQMVPSNSSKLLSMYEQREMVCPMCNKHFLGLQALETHISWAHKVKDPKTKVITDAKGVAKSTDQVARDRDCLLVGLAAANMLHHAGGMRSGVLRAAAGAVADECAQKKRKIACFVCKELYTDMVALNAHIRKQHVKSRSEQVLAGAKQNGLKQQMTTALGGLLDRALTSMLTKVPLPPVDKSASDGDSNMDEPAKNWDDTVLKSVPSMHINMDPPLTLTAIAKKAIKPVTIEKSSPYDSSEPEMSKAARLTPDAVISNKRKRSAPRDAQRTEDVEKPPPLFPENFVTPSTFDPILPEPQGSDMQCPICLGAVKHFHSLCRHLKTQHTEWSMNTFNTDLFHYLILKRENPLITINKKYSIYIPVRANQQHLQQQEQAVASTSTAPDEAIALSSAGTVVVPEETPPSIEEVKEDDVIRQKAFAALQQLSTKKSVRGSKRRPLDLSELATLDKDKEAAS